MSIYADAERELMNALRLKVAFVKWRSSPAGSDDPANASRSVVIALMLTGRSRHGKETMNMNRSTMKTSEWRRRYARRALATVVFAALPAAAWCSDGAGAPVTKLGGKDEPTAVRSWLVAGPLPSPDVLNREPNGPRRAGYDTDYLVGIGGETAARPREGTRVTAQTGNVEFQRRTWNTEYIDLTEVYGRPEQVCAYLYAEVESPRDTSLYLHFGSNDAGKVWIGAKLVAARATDGSARRSQSVGLVRLKAGRNPVLVKVDQAGANWGAYVEFSDKATSLAAVSVSESGGGTVNVNFNASPFSPQVTWSIAAVTAVCLLFLFGWIPLVFWLYFRARNRHEQREHELWMAMVAKGMIPVVEVPKRPPARPRKGLVILGFLLALAGLGLTIAEVADSGLANAGFELAVMFAGIALVVTAEYLRRTAERDHREEEPPARPNDAA